MFRVRVFLLWLLMAAVPLQGWAAATALLCGGATQRQTQAAHHQAHAGGQHHHAAGHATHAMGHDVASADDSSQPDGARADGGHTCAVCAACCHGMALTETRLPPLPSAAPQADLAEPLVAVHSRPSTVLERPPRA